MICARRPCRRSTQRGLTVIELVIAVGLLALLMVSVFAVMRG
jgi:type II secretory pathway component PulJ